LQDCDSAEYVRLVEALAQEHSINIIKVLPRPVSPFPHRFLQAKILMFVRDCVRVL
jgi:hypothetical protein